ncbi:hypothetical protein EDB80DRAFT_815187 [Ilyonectria destructans]|nr:hypothetical protein EDB80DRAFT_815187 [Ilyonectria destructans]
MTVIEHHRLPRQLLHNHFFQEASHIRGLLGIRGRRRIGQKVPNVRGRKRKGLITRCITTPERLDLTSRRQTNPRQCMLRIPGLLGSSFFFINSWRGGKVAFSNGNFYSTYRGPATAQDPRPENHDLGTRREERGFVLVFPYDAKSRRGKGGGAVQAKETCYFPFSFYYFLCTPRLLFFCLPTIQGSGGRSIMYNNVLVIFPSRLRLRDSIVFALDSARVYMQYAVPV